MAGDCLSFTQGQIALLTAQFVTSPEGSPVDVPDATVEVFGPGGAVILPATPMIHVLTGFYYYDWAIPNSEPVGTYTVRYTGTVLGTPTAATDTLKILEAGAMVSTSQRVIDLVAALEKYISCAQNIPVYAEVARRSADKQTYQLSWPRWNLGNHAIFLNNEIVTEGYTINLDTGTITFDTPRHYTDRVEASYNFRFFSYSDLVRFLTDALSQINLEAPGTGWTLETMPDSYVGVLMLGGAKNAIMKLLMCLTFQEPATIFGGKDGVNDAISNLKSLKENYEQQFTTDKKAIKRARYPSTVSIVQPSMSLPGGRCISLDSISIYKLEDKTIQLDMQEAYDVFESGKLLEVLSHSSSGELVFAEVSKIWLTDSKKKWILTTESGKKIFASSEHLFFVNGEYKPMMDIVCGDKVLCINNSGQMITDFVDKIVDTNETIGMCDMEVPSTQNFFANGIKCHNSRWFRYLFSGNSG